VLAGELKTRVQRMTSIAAALQSQGRVAQAGGRSFAPTSDPYRNVIAILMVFTISRIHQYFGFLTPFRPLLVLVALSGLYALMNPRYLEVPRAMKTRSFKLISAFGIMACLSVPFGISMGNSAVFILTEYSKVLLFGILVLFDPEACDFYSLHLLLAVGHLLGYFHLFYRMHGTKRSFVRIQRGTA
jgi:hypothetical protein